MAEPEVVEADGVRRIRDPFQPNAKQIEFFRACADPYAEEVLYDGSIRAGKTQAACKQIIAWAWKHGGRYLVARKTYPELVDSTMKIMLNGEGGLPPSCPHELMLGGSLAKGFKAGERTLTLANGAEILFRNLESAEEGRAKLRNISLNGLFIDQVEELDGDEWGEFFEELMGRLSDPRGPRKAILAANPGPTDHWVYKRYIDPESRLEWTRYVHCTLYDNQENLDPRYFESRVRTRVSNPEYYKRMVLGEWGAFGGKRYKCWDASRHVVEPFQIPHHWEVFEAIDYGYAHPFCCLWFAVDPQERWYVFAEHYERERAISWHAKQIKVKRDEWGISPSVTWCDPSIFRPQGEYESVAIEMADQGLYPAKAQNDRLGGWARLEEFLTSELPDPADPALTVPKLRIFRDCRNLIKELPNLRFKDNTDDVEKKNDHAADACRYGVQSRPYVPPEPAADAIEDRRSLYMKRKLAEAQRALEPDLIYD